MLASCKRLMVNMPRIMRIIVRGHCLRKTRKTMSKIPVEIIAVVVTAKLKTISPSQPWGVPSPPTARVSMTKMLPRVMGRRAAKAAPSQCIFVF